MTHKGRHVSLSGSRSRACVAAVARSEWTQKPGSSKPLSRQDIAARGCILAQVDAAFTVQATIAFSQKEIQRREVGSRKRRAGRGVAPGRRRNSADAVSLSPHRIRWQMKGFLW